MMKAAITMLAIFVLATFAPHGGFALECTDMAHYITPCVPYVTRNSDLGTCCPSLSGLYTLVQTTPDIQTMCNCFKSLTNGYSSDQIDRAVGLPDQCKINVPYKIDPSTDCSRVH